MKPKCSVSTVSSSVQAVCKIGTKPRGRPRLRCPVLASISPRHGPDRVIRILFPVPCSFHCLLGIQSITGWPHQLPKLHAGEIFHQHGHLHSLALTWGGEKECQEKKQKEIMRLMQWQKYKAASKPYTELCRGNTRVISKDTSLGIMKNGIGGFVEWCIYSFIFRKHCISVRVWGVGFGHQYNVPQVNAENAQRKVVLLHSAEKVS